MRETYRTNLNANEIAIVFIQVFIVYLMIENEAAAAQAEKPNIKKLFKLKRRRIKKINNGE